MNIFGIGGAELVIIIVIMLVVAGPQRMIRWMYVLGRYMAVLQRMWSETAAVLQKEFDDAGVEVKVPKQLPTKGELRKQVTSAMNPVTRPLQDIQNEVKGDLDSVRESTKFTTAPVLRNTAQKNGAPAASATKNGNAHTPAEPDETNFGTWSAGDSEGQS